jgi:hypothetical protein
MKKRRVKWPFGNPDFTAFEVESAAGVLVARRNHALVRTGERLCQGWDLWLDGKFAGALNSRTLSDLATHRIAQYGKGYLCRKDKVQTLAQFF